MSRNDQRIDRPLLPETTAVRAWCPAHLAGLGSAAVWRPDRYPAASRTRATSADTGSPAVAPWTRDLRYAGWMRSPGDAAVGIHGRVHAR
jgi:hypothetical protein